MKNQTEFIRLLDNEPLTLSCSALADFLWDDFIRDARPSVRYLIDVHNIKQLSRFGKELFDRLYNCDNVTWLVQEQDYEDYFRKVCDGDTAALPKGYKPENGIWYSIMGDLSQSASWIELLQRSVGNQFNAGNNSINILNLLSSAIEEAINEKQFDVDLLTGSEKQLQTLRKELKKAQEKGDAKATDRIKQEGKRIVSEINEAIQNAKAKLQANTHKVVDSVVKQNDELNEAMSTLWGSSPGVRQKLFDLDEKKDLAKKLANNQQLKSLVKKLGSLKKVWQERKQARKSRATYESITGATFSDDITKTFPVELALASSEEGKALFALKYSQKTLLTKDFTAHKKDLGKGPIILYVDVSGSMGGENELWSKAITFVIVEQALKEHRDVYVNLFDTKVQISVELLKSRKTNKEMIDFIGCWTLGGGTSFNAVVAHFLDHAKKETNADILLITDGHAEIENNFVKRLKTYKQQNGLQWSTICINSVVPSVCHQISDEVFAVNTHNQEDTVDAVQKCIR